MRQRQCSSAFVDDALLIERKTERSLLECRIASSPSSRTWFLDVSLFCEASYFQIRRLVSRTVFVYY